MGIGTKKEILEKHSQKIIEQPKGGLGEKTVSDPHGTLIVGATVLWE